jgi:Putative binding domain, N-terminal
MTIPRCCAFVALFWIVDASPASAQCSYSIGKTTFSVLSTSSIQSTSVITGTQCSWTATTADSWITITNGTNHIGLGSVSFQVAANPTSSVRTGTLLVAGQTITVTQAANSCTYSVGPTSFAIDALSTSRTISVTAGTQCSWGATTAETWITITNPGAGIGISAVTFSVTANGAATQRVGTLTVAGQTVTVTQAGNPTATPPAAPSNLRIVR